VATPSFNPDGGTFFITQARTVTITTATAGANIRYTLNGTAPTATTGTLIGGSSGTVSVTPSTDGRTLQAVAFKPGMTDSLVYSATYYYEHGDSADPGSPTSAAPPVYDANGNLTNYNGWIYTYDGQNRLMSANNGTHTASFYYDGRNRQIARVIDNQVRFSVWDDWELIEESASSSSRSAAYLQGAHGVIKSLMNNVYYYQGSLGSTTHLADGVGQLLESYRYDLYGKPSYFNSTSQPLNSSTYNVVDLYAGERWVGELGLYDLRNRFMSPELGRFIQADPIGFKGDGSNLYRYCHNDPADFSDPSGLIDAQWSKEMWLHGNSPYSFDRLMEMHTDQPAGNITYAPIWVKKAEGNGGKSMNDTTINQLGKQLGADKDQTTAIVPTKEGLQVTDAATEVKTPRGGDGVSFGYSGARETFNLRSDALRTIHAHTREGAKFALPSKDDDSAVQHSGGKPMYFTSRYLARHGADPDGTKGNYIIYHFTGPRPLDIPRPEYRFDQRLSLPPLPGG
jgi:RHS repeat-associated protein